MQQLPCTKLHQMCNEGQREDEDVGVTHVYVGVCLIILTWAALGANTWPTAWRQTDGTHHCSLFFDLPPTPSSVPFLQTLHQLTLHVSFLPGPTFSFSICGVLGSFPPQGLHAEFIFIFPFHDSLFSLNPPQLTGRSSPPPPPPSFLLYLTLSSSSSSSLISTSLPYSCCFGLVK